MKTQKRTPWRRWIVLILMIAGWILAGIYAPVRPEITVAAEKLIEEPLFEIPGIGPFYLVNTLPTLAVTIVLLLVIGFAANRSLVKSQKTDLVPTGIGNVMEAILEMLYNLTESSAGAKWARAIFPWFATIMIYVLFANLLKLLPGFESIGVLHPAAHGGHEVEHLHSGWYIYDAHLHEDYILAPFFRGISVDLNFTLTLAVISFLAIQYIGIRAQGLAYFSKFFNVKRMFTTPFFGAMDFLVGLLEVISEFAKILSFTFRLFGNMFAGVVLVAVVASLLGNVSILAAMIMMFELFVGLIQAFVFGMLTMVFMAMATQGHGEHDEHEGAHAVEHEI